LTLVDTNLALGNTAALNQPLLLTSPSASSLPVSTLLRSTSISALLAAGLAGSKSSFALN
jgi:hypothetical protein